MNKTTISALLLGTTLMVLFSFHHQRLSEELQAPVDLHPIGHVQSQGCRRCHEDHYQSWSETFHRRMTQEATEESVLGAFDGRSIDYFGWTLRFVRRGGGFLVVARSPAGERLEYRIVRTVGSHRYQQYLGEDPEHPGTLLRLPFAWDPQRETFLHMNGAFLTPDPQHPASQADFERHVTRWNDNCVFCHNVAPNPGQQDGGPGVRFETEVAELGVACEACHGPGELHAARNSDPLRRYRLHGGDEADPTIVNPDRLPDNLSADICGRCHGQRLTGDIAAVLRDGDPFVPGDDLARYSEPLWQDTRINGIENTFTNRFWNDGSPRLTAYEYQGWLQSPCSQATENATTCTTCHGMHGTDPNLQLRPGHAGQESCKSCHPTQDEAPSSHHLHEAPIECVDCHSPANVYGLVSIHRSHRVTSPSPRDTMGDGAAPNACLLCHGERNVPWAQRQIAQLWPGTGTVPEATPATPRPALETLLLSGDPIERAVAAHAYRNARPAADPRHRQHLLLDTMIHDPYPAVRQIALRSLRTLLGADRERFLRGYNPLAPQGERQQSLQGLATHLGLPAALPGATALRQSAAEHTIFIGE